MVKADIALHMPDNLSFEDAATTGVTILTTGRCLVGTLHRVQPCRGADDVALKYQKLGIPPPPSKSSGDHEQIFIYGGRLSDGNHGHSICEAVSQFGRDGYYHLEPLGLWLLMSCCSSNFEIITTCSPRNFALVRSYGADHVFDYNDPKAMDLVKSQTHGTVKLCVDCISTDSSAAFCAAVLAPGATYSSIGMSRCPRDDVKTEQTMGYSFLGEPWQQMGHHFPASR